MKITVCGSIKFAKELVKICKELEKQGHTPLMQEDMYKLVDGTAEELIDMANGVETAEIKKKYDYIKAWHKLIDDSDAILVCNFDKNGIKNYIGGNTLMEIGFAYVGNKKIFLLNSIPEDVSYTDEIRAMMGVELNGDLNKID